MCRQSDVLHATGRGTNSLDPRPRLKRGWSGLQSPVRSAASGVGSGGCRRAWAPGYIPLACPGSCRSERSCHPRSTEVRAHMLCPPFIQASSSSSMCMPMRHAHASMCVHYVVRHQISVLCVTSGPIARAPASGRSGSGMGLLTGHVHLWTYLTHHGYAGRSPIAGAPGVHLWLLAGR